ncbi:MAG: AsmA-like C-terminal region-containing protein [Candidatus Gastranaerophilales bacterium]|nr:AsmA-like C-terminal region-containing protein [Candidatus Gastranaerophilales bacterium]
MKFRLKLLLYISFFVLLYAAYYWGIPAVVDIQHRLPDLQRIVKKEMGADIKLIHPRLKMGLIPAVWLDAYYFSIEDPGSSPLVIVNPKIKIRLLPLLFGKIHPAYFSCDKINADLKIDKDYRLYIGNHLIIRNANPKISIEDSRMEIGNYAVNLKDELQNKNILISGDYFSLKKYNSKKYIRFSTNSKIKVDDRYSVINADVDFKLPLKKGFDTNEILFDGAITNFNLADISPYIRKFSKSNILKTQGILNIEAGTKVLSFRKSQIKSRMVINDLAIVPKNQPPIYFKDKLNIITILDVSKNVLNIEKFNLSSGHIHTNILGKIKKISSQTPVLDLSVIIDKSRMEDFISLLPSKNFKNIDIDIIALKKYGYYGNVEGKLLIKGKSDKPEITGDFISNEGYLIKPKDAPKITLKLKFLGNKVYIDVFVSASETQNLTVKGPIDLYGDKPAYLDILSTSDVDLKIIESVLNPAHEIFLFDLGPLPVMKLQGLGNIKLKTSGSKKDPHLFGVLNFKNTTGSFNGIEGSLNNVEGILTFKDKDTYFVTNKAFLNSNPVKIDGRCSLSGDLDYNITANNQNLDLLLNILTQSPMLSELENLIPAMEKADGKINLKMKLQGKSQTINDFKLNKNVFASGNIKLLGNNIVLSGLQVPVKNLFGNINFKNNDADFDLYSVVDKSKIYIKGKVKNKILDLKMKLDDIAFLYSNIPTRIFSGDIEVHDNRLTLYKVNGVLDSMPFLVDGYATDIFKNPHFNVYLNSKPTQKFIDKQINKNSLYPLKVKGDVIYSARIHGTRDYFNAQAEINLGKDSYIYYMGSSLGDSNNPIRIFLDTNVSKNSVYVNNFQYDKLISSQNDKEFISQQLNAKGQINLTKNDIVLNNFRVKTQNPTDAKIFNILFRKPLIKQGLFNSDVVINNSISSPKMIGVLNFTGIDIPLLDTTIKDISLDFTQSNINIKSKGEIFGNKIVLFANMQNRLIPPYVLSDVDIYLGNLDINQIVKSIDKLDIETDINTLAERKQGFNITNLIVKNAKLKADSVLIRNIFAKNLRANFSLNEKLLFSLDNFKFDLAEGKINGDFTYNLLNSKSSLELHVDNANANAMTEALFDLHNQIYGSLTGQANLTCNGKSHKTCMDTLNGTGRFIVADGRMPKLGSLEYLLKAANLVKSGITGLTLNSLIDIVTPLKTGQFENINGDFTINSGIADSIQIFSRGKDLSLFLTGKYNFSTLIADMQIFGRISKKISNVLGPVGNTSLNTLFNAIPGFNPDENNKSDFVNNLNKIPGFELNDKTYRIFSAEIYGDINGENYVRSFKWVE